MHAVLIGPFAIAALVLAVAGAIKLRSPDAAARAARSLGLPVGRALIRALAALELALSLWCLIAPTALSACVLASAYGSLAAIALALARRQAACGCFGREEGPTSTVHWALSALLALPGLAAVWWTPHGLVWLISHHPALSAVLVVGVAGGAYALVTVYTQLPPAWGAWNAR